MSRTTSRSRMAVALALTALVAACTADTDVPPVATTTASTSAPAPPSSSPPPPPSTAPVTAEEAKQQALDAYLGMQAAFAAAGRTSDPDHPDLPKYTTGPALELLAKVLTTRKTNGTFVRGETVHHAKVTELSSTDAPSKALVQDCMDTRNGSLYKANGDPVPQDKGGFRLALADLTRTDGTWKVTDLAVREVGTCKP